MVEPNAIRNIALVGHTGSGKTTVAEGLLAAAGLSGSWAAPDAGHFDFLEEEKERGSSIATALFQGRVQDRVLTVIDTPGAGDFIGETIGALTAVETAVFVVAANQGIAVNTRKAAKIAADLKMPRAVVITKPDLENVHLDELQEELRTLFGAGLVPVIAAQGAGAGFTGVADVRAASGDAREKLTEAVCGADEALMERYFENGALSADDLAAGFTKAMVSGDLVPAFIVCRPKECGHRELLGAILAHFPSPADVMTARFEKGGEPCTPAPGGPLVARVFKSHLDPFVGRVNYLRVYAGTAKRDGAFLNPETGKGEKLGIPQVPLGPKLGETAEAGPGMIVGMAKVEALRVGHPVIDPALEGLTITTTPFPRPMMMVAVEPVARKDADKLNASFRKMADVDPCLALSRDEQTGTLVVAGNTDLHLRICLERLRRQDKVECVTKPPRVPYRETVTAAAACRYRHKKQSGGSGEFAEVEIVLGPAEAEFLATGEDTLQYEDKLRGMNVDRVYVPSVEKGIRDVMRRGVLAGFPVINVKVAFVDGKQHDVDSKDRAFQVAGREAFRAAFLGEKRVPRDWNEPNFVRGDPKATLLEPIVTLDVTVPGRFQGAILGDLNKRRGQVQGQDSEGDMATITARVPQAEVLNYSSELQTITAGEGFFTMAFSHYEQVPGNIVQEIVAKAAREREDKER